MSLSLVDCKKGRLYRVRARNFNVAVFNGTSGFIGIQYEWGYKTLFTEYHWDKGPPHGTVRAVEDTGVDCPSGIQLVERLGVVDRKTGRPVKFDTPVANGGKGWYFEDTGESSQEIQAVGVPNNALLTWLEQHENAGS